MPPTSASGAAKAVEDRLARLQNVETRYSLREDYTPDGAALALSQRLLAQMRKAHPGMLFSHAIHGNFLYRCGMSFLSRRVRYERIASRSTAVRVGAGAPRLIESKMPGRVEVLEYPPLPQTSPGGELSADAPPPDSLAICTVLGLRDPSRRHWAWIRPGSVKKMAYARLSRRRFSLTQTTAGGNEYRWVFRQTTQGLALISLAASSASKSGSRYVYLRGEFSNFRSVKGLLLPRRATETFFGGPGIPDPVRCDALTNVRYKVGSPSNVPKNYLILWPKGATVIDERIDRVFHIKSPTTLSDKDIFLRLRKRDGGTHK
jgi:hypothetical protein